MKYSKETIKQFIKDYQNNTTIDISESELDIDNFFEISGKSEYFIFYLLCQGKTFREVGNIFNLSGERIRQLYNGLLYKIADEVY